MTVYQSNLDYALDSDPAFPDIDTPWALATRENFKYDWEFGYRAVIGLQFDCSSIGSKVMYTHYKNSHKEKVLDELGRAASTTLFPGSDERLFERIRSSLELDYDLVDWVFDHRLKTWQKCHIIPFIGFRTLRLEQEMLIKHHDFIDEENPKTTISFDSETKSAGILGGLDVCFCSDCGFGLYGQFGCSILGARYEVTSEQFRFDDDGEIDELAVNENSITEEKIYSGLFGCQGALGFTYNLRCNCVDIDFMLGYELNYWNHIPSFRRFTSQVATVYTNGTSHLLLHGGVFRAAVRF